MADFRARRLEPGQTKFRNVPIAVTPEGFWCCPSPAVLQKTLKNHNHQNKQKGSPPPLKDPSLQKAPTPPTENIPLPNQLRSRAVLDDQRCMTPDASAASPTKAPERPPKPNGENQKRKICVGFGQPETSDLKVILFGKEGIAVRIGVHRNILAEHSSFFADKLSRQSPVPYIEIMDCEDVEIYVETVGLMYCKEVKHRLIKQSVPRVLRILKVAESLGYRSCIKSCLDFLEAVPWVGEEEENVVISIRHLQNDNYGVNPILKRVSSDISNPPNDTLARILELVLKSNEDRGRREMKSLVLKLLKENSLWTNGSADICIETLYSSCHNCLDSLLALFREASEPGFADKSLESKDPVVRQIALGADNLLWLVEILADRHIAGEFAVMWSSQNELSELHSKLPIVSRHPVSCITARLFVAIGRGEVLPSMDTRQLLLHVWLQPLIDDYSWLQHVCRSFDRKVVEEGIGQTILTLPLEDQQNILLSWFGSFLKVGDNCPNLQRAFEVWWRRTFIRPYVEQQGNLAQSARS
ncbi:BTB/POZ domain-containing protein At3g50780-like [Phoenix dactylifera]|uniref:BTB/POZ domain-containing protein At3g50780-like n=1 Tax=Phoenix dactylifera TaxID=42345 RepID=A0A8B7CDR3_PHODC|nr:BTB/POZ domain-containing protein At3g50780-like [Phoenix dactylifera]XP_038971652.1 BTB/POZ domain-containing protein At3g50780-like [Phoenix dactylifera]